jgi:hypothetical protein
MRKFHIRSDDARKPAIIASLKQQSGGTKVTNVHESEDGNGNIVYGGDCLKKRADGKWDNLGTFFVSHQEIRGYETRFVS